jgi:hypothetical protein
VGSLRLEEKVTRLGVSMRTQCHGRAQAQAKGRFKWGRRCIGSQSQLGVVQVERREGVDHREAVAW